MRPFARIATRLQSASASLRTCELKNTVQPRSRSRRIRARTSRRPSGSRPDIGSSRMTRSGSLMSACAMPTRCSMPLENLRSGSRRSLPMPTSSSSAFDATPALGGRDAEQPAVVGEQFLGGQVIVEVGLFRQVAEAALGREIAGRTSENARFAGRRKDQLQQQLQGGGLAGAVGSEKAEDLARFDLQGETVEDTPGPLPPEANGVVFGQLDGFDRKCQSFRGRLAPQVRRVADRSRTCIGHLAARCSSRAMA